MKLADTAPTYCSACHNQNNEVKHVDFEAYWDGPTLGTDSNIMVAIDDLILCEDCLGVAARLIGYINNKEIRKENFELGRALEEKDKIIEDYRKGISDLEHTLGVALSGKLRRGAGRPQIRIPENLDEIIAEREKSAA